MFTLSRTHLINPKPNLSHSGDATKNRVHRTFDYFPNRDGIYWFVNNCWPQIKRQVPHARLRLVGQDSDGCLEHFGPDVDCLGGSRIPQMRSRLGLQW